MSITNLLTDRKYAQVMAQNYDTMSATLGLIEVTDEKEKYVGKDNQKEAFQQLATDDKKHVQELESLWWWFIAQGASMLFGISNLPTSFYSGQDKGASFFSRVSMRKGPGDVVKGSFAT